VTRFVERPSGTWEIAYELEPIGGRMALERGNPTWWVGLRRTDRHRWYSGVIPVDPDVDSEELFAAIGELVENARRRDASSATVGGRVGS